LTANFDDLRFAVVDVEGNGQQPPEIVEIAVQHLDGLTLVGEPKSWLVRPARPISPVVTRKVHGITDADVADASTIGELAPTLLAVLRDRIPVAHNATVEKAVLGAQLETWQPAMILDTMRLAKQVWPGLKSYGLDPLLAQAQISVGDRHGTRHRAGFDAYATALLFAVLADSTGNRFRLFEWASLPGSAVPTGPATPAEGTLW
jgi:DNA polymerase III epsilon subunit-like protein